MTRPGTRLRALAARVCSDKTMERLIDPVIAGLQAEYASAIAWPQRSRARVLGYIAFAKVFLLCGVFAMHQGWRNWDVDDWRNLRRVLWCSTVVTLTFAILIEMPELRRLPEAVNVGTGARHGVLLALLVPAALATSIPIGLFAGTALGLHGCPLSRRLLGGVLLLAIGTSAIAFVNVAWVVPASNQFYREELVSDRPPFRGDRELTLTELRRAAQHPSGSNPEKHARRLEFLFHQRLALAVAPLTFAVFAIALTIRRRLRRAATVVATFIVIACTIFMWMLGQFWSSAMVVPPSIEAWLSQIVLMCATLFLALSPRRRAA